MSTHAHTTDRSPFGFWVYLMSDCVLFGALFATYAVLQHSTYGGPAIYDFAHLPFVFAETMLLLVSSFTAGLALLAARGHRKVLLLGALAATFVLGACFLGLEVQEFSRLIAEGTGPARSAFLSAFFALVGTHGLHIFFGSIWMLALVLYLAVKGITETLLRRLGEWVLFWHFLDLIWIFIFTFVYLFGLLAF